MPRGLQGLRVLNTRPIEEARELTALIEREGGKSIECPAATIEPLTNWLMALPDLNQVKTAIFISNHAAKYFFNALQQAQIAWPSTIQVITLGQNTAAKLTKLNINVDFFPEMADSEHLVGLSSLQKIDQDTILLIKGVGGRTLIYDTLSTRGAKVLAIDVYQRLKPTLNPQWLEALRREDAIDIILFTSQELMHNIFNSFSKNAQPWLCRKPCVVFSERLAKEALKLGMHTIIQSRPEKLLETLQHFNQGLIHGQ